MTKLEELKAARDAANAVYDAAWYSAREAAEDVYGAAWDTAYEAELKKQKEKQND